MAYDGSKDGTSQALEQMSDHDMKVHISSVNFGKEMAKQISLSYMTGDLIVVQGADWECDPSDLGQIVKPLVAGKAEWSLGHSFSEAIRECP